MKLHVELTIETDHETLEGALRAIKDLLVHSVGHVSCITVQPQSNLDEIYPTKGGN
jgi:hypothetical protein